MGLPAEQAPAPLTRPLPEPPALVAQTLAAIEVALGGRDSLVAALAYAPKTKDVGYLLGIIGDPRHAKRSLAQLCAMGGITPGELLSSYKAGVIHQAQALSTKIVGEELQGVVKDTFRLAAPHEVLCPTCEGLTTITPEPTRKNPNPEPQTCPTCKGKGRSGAEGEIEHKKLALELGQLTAKSSGITLNMQQNNLSMGGVGGALEHLQAASDRILYGEGVGAVIMAEVEAGPAAEIAGEIIEGVCAAPSPVETRIEGDWTEDPS